MSRQRRQLSQTGLYHIIFRGIGRQNIFEEKSDYEKLKEILKKVKGEINFEIYAYCFMTNHVHLFIKEKNMGEETHIFCHLRYFSGIDDKKCAFSFFRSIFSTS